MAAATMGNCGGGAGRGEAGVEVRGVASGEVRRRDGGPWNLHGRLEEEMVSRTGSAFLT